jgi:hypothetical protein
LTNTQCLEEEFRTRLIERHGEGYDATETIRVVKTELVTADVPFGEFLRSDAEKTTSPRKLTNPPGYYRDLARELANCQRNYALERVLKQGMDLRKAVQAAATTAPDRRCSCCNGFACVSFDCRRGVIQRGRERDSRAAG